MWSQAGRGPAIAGRPSWLGCGGRARGEEEKGGRRARTAGRGKESIDWAAGCERARRPAIDARRPPTERGERGRRRRRSKRKKRRRRRKRRRKRRRWRRKKKRRGRSKSCRKRFMITYEMVE